MLPSYYEVLLKLAGDYNVSLLSAFKEAGVPSSTFYRTHYGAELKHRSACKIFAVLSNPKVRRRLPAPKPTEVELHAKYTSTDSVLRETD